MLYKFIVILILIICVLLAIVVLIQNSKGGGLAANFSSANQIMGVRKTTDSLEKVTWILAILLVVFSIAATASIPHQVSNENLKTDVSVEDYAPVQAPAAQAPIAAEQAPSTQE